MSGMNRLDGRLLTGRDHIAQSIADILSTRLGTALMRPDYGSELPDLVDRPVVQGWQADATFAVADAIRRNEDRFRLTRVTFAHVAPGRVALTLDGRLTATGQRFVLESLEVGR